MLLFGNCLYKNRGVLPLPKKILMLSTGGTIASVPGENGLLPQISGETMVQMIPELKGLCDITCREIMNIDSSNIMPSDWRTMAEAIEASYGDYDGFVITHGTDTMAYTSSALSLMLRNLSKPVILTGSQLPIESPLTDAKKNISDAFKTSVYGRRGVYIVFNGRIICGSKAKKLYSESFDAFHTINGEDEGKIINGTVFFDSPEKEPAAGVFHTETKMEEKILTIKLFPGADPKILDYAAENKIKGIVIEGYGAGGIPYRGKDFTAMTARAVKSGIMTVVATQCTYDGTDMSKYEVGVLAEKAGALPAGKMTYEAVVTKMMWALGNAKTEAEAVKLFKEEIL